MAVKKKAVYLLSTGTYEDGRPTNHAYTRFPIGNKMKNKKLELMKFDPRIRKHVKYVQKKIPTGT